VTSRKTPGDQGKASPQFVLKWFKSLSINEKNIALTTIDKELV
jgi:hypothetical protein